MEKKTNNLVIIPKIEKYIEYMPTILLKLPRTEKFSIGTEIKTSMYEMLKNILLDTGTFFMSTSRHWDVLYVYQCLLSTMKIFIKNNQKVVDM